MTQSRQLKLVQRSRFKWDLIAPKGHILADDMRFSSVYKAVEWCNAYISSYPSWSYVIVFKEDK